MQAMMNLLNMFQDKNGKVREAISWVMSRICEHHADVLTNPNVINLFLKNVLQFLSDKPRISGQCCQALEKLAASLEPINRNQESNALTPFYGEIIQFLMVNAKREDGEGIGIDLTQASYVALTALVQNSCTNSNPLTE